MKGNAGDGGDGISGKLFIMELGGRGEVGMENGMLICGICVIWRMGKGTAKKKEEMNKIGRKK